MSACMKKMAAFTVVLAAWGAADAFAQVTTISLREAICVGGERITLGQIAEITPADAAEGLAPLELGPAPLPGGSRSLTVGYLKMRLRHSGVTCGEIAFLGADAVEVRRALSPLGPAPGAQDDLETGGSSVPRQVLVPRGTRLRLTVTCGAILIGADATLLDDGFVGGQARMRIEQTRETVVAQIVLPTEARLRTPGDEE